MRVKPVYKCHLCGRLLSTGESKEIPYEKLPSVLGKVIQNQLFAGNPALHETPMNIPCKCPDGSAGLAYFAGFKSVE